MCDVLVIRLTDRPSETQQQPRVAENGLLVLVHYNLGSGLVAGPLSEDSALDKYTYPIIVAVLVLNHGEQGTAAAAPLTRMASTCGRYCR